MSALTSRYARAFVDVVIGNHLDAGAVLRELHTVCEVAGGSKDLQAVWESPAIPAAQKRSVLDAIAGREGMSRPVRNFLAVLIDHRRIQMLGQVVRDFEQEMNSRLGFAEATIESARPLEDAEKHLLEGQLEKLTGKKVRAQYSQDASLLGGAVVRVGSTIYDGSVLGQLQKIREMLSS